MAKVDQFSAPTGDSTIFANFSPTFDAHAPILLPDGGGMAIGGLIDEKDIETQQKVPILGDLWGVGRMFQRRRVDRQRSEIIIALIPRIMPAYGQPIEEVAEFDRASTRLLLGPLIPNHRPWEADLPDAIQNPRTIRIDGPSMFLRNLDDSYPHPVDSYFPSASEQRSWVHDLPSS